MRMVAAAALQGFALLLLCINRADGASGDSDGRPPPTEVQYSKSWAEDVKRLGADLARSKNIPEDEVDTFITDNNGLEVYGRDLPEKGRFPLQVRVAPWTTMKSGSVRKIEVSYSEQWSDDLEKEIEGFAKENSVTRESFTISVRDKDGVVVTRGEDVSYTRFPLKVKLVPEKPSQKVVVEIPFSVYWTKNIAKTIHEFAEDYGADVKEVGTAVVDNSGKTVLGDDQVEDASRFPLSLHLIIHRAGPATEDKTFSVEYREEWQQQLTKRMMEFSALHGIRPDAYSMIVADTDGKPVGQESKPSPDKFPLVVTFTPKDKKKAKKRRRARKSEDPPDTDIDQILKSLEGKTKPEKKRNVEL